MFIHVITPSDTAELFKGDGTVIPKMTKARFRVFRKSPGDDPFSATVVVTDLPASATEKSKTLMAAFRPGQTQARRLADQEDEEDRQKAAKKPVKTKKAKRG